MDVGISTACFFPCLTEETIDIVNKLGFKKIEVFLEAESEYSLGFCKKLKEKTNAFGIEIVSIHSFCSPFEPYIFSGYERRSRDSLKIFEKVTRAAQCLGAKYYTFHGNRAEVTNDEFDFTKFGKMMSYLADFSFDMGVTLAWENVAWCQSSSPSFIKSALEYITSDKLRFTLYVKQALRSSIDPMEYVAVMAEKIANVHINDGNKIKTCLLPGCGEIDLASIIAALFRNDYKNDLLIEVYNENFDTLDDIKRSKLYLERVIKNFST